MSIFCVCVGGRGSNCNFNWSFKEAINDPKVGILGIPGMAQGTLTSEFRSVYSYYILSPGQLHDNPLGDSQVIKCPSLPKRHPSHLIWELW